MINDKVKVDESFLQGDDGENSSSKIVPTVRRPIKNRKVKVEKNIKEASKSTDAPRYDPKKMVCPKCDHDLVYMDVEPGVPRSVLEVELPEKLELLLKKEGALMRKCSKSKWTEK